MPGQVLNYSGGENTAATRVIAWTGGTGATTLTPGADQVPVSGTVYFGDIYVPQYVTATGIGFLLGTVGGTDKCIVTLYDRGGAFIASSSTAGGGTTAGTASTFQELSFSAIQRLPADLYYIGVQFNGTTARGRVSVIAGGRGSSFAGASPNVGNITPTTTGAATQFAYLF